MPECTGPTIITIIPEKSRINSQKQGQTSENSPKIALQGMLFRDIINYVVQEAE